MSDSCNPKDCSPSGSSVRRILQARTLDWGAISLLQGIFPTQGSNLGLLQGRQILYHLNHQGSPSLLKCQLPLVKPFLRLPNIPALSFSLHRMTLGSHLCRGTHQAVLDFLSSPACLLTNPYGSQHRPSGRKAGSEATSPSPCGSARLCTFSFLLRKMGIKDLVGFHPFVRD